MNNLLFQRISSSPRQDVIQVINGEIRDDEKNAPAAEPSPIVSPDVLREKLMEKLNPAPKIVEAILDGSMQIELIHFANLFEFGHWYENNRNLFSERQQQPLDSLLEARSITVGGCNCDGDKRKFIAEDYFRKFWTQNKNTDLLPTLQNILKTKKILFGDFLSYPE
jgi:hypothetical protein